MNSIDELNLKLGIGPKRPTLPIGLQRAGYISIKTLGKGTFGQAHLLFHSARKQYVVAKHINLASMTSKQIAEARNEITLLQSFDHPNIVKYFEAVEDHPNLYILMEYCDGGDVYETLRRQDLSNTRFTEPEVLSLFAQISSAVKHLHDKRVLHRDLKTQNVFLMKNGVAKLGDFGISTSLKSTMAMAKTMCGTPYYFSPELVQGQPYNNKSDIWALGVMLYELITHKMPFEAKSMKQLLDAIVKLDSPKLPSYCSSELQDLFRMMLCKDMTKRPDINGVLRSSVLRKFVPELAQDFLFCRQPVLVAPKPISTEEKQQRTPQKIPLPQPSPATQQQQQQPTQIVLPAPSRHLPIPEPEVPQPPPRQPILSTPVRNVQVPTPLQVPLPPPPVHNTIRMEGYRSPNAKDQFGNAAMQKSLRQVAEVLQSTMIEENLPEQAFGDDVPSDPVPEEVDVPAPTPNVAGRYDTLREDEDSDDVFSGSCTCGTILFSVQKINKVFCTHSRVARRLCGGAFTAFVSVSAKDFVVEEGDQFLKPFYVSDGDFTKTFCAKCGTTVVHLFPSTKEAWIPISNLNDPGNDLFPISHFELEEGVDYFPVLSMS